MAVWGRWETEPWRCRWGSPALVVLALDHASMVEFATLELNHHDVTWCLMEQLVFANSDSSSAKTLLSFFIFSFSQAKTSNSFDWNDELNQLHWLRAKQIHWRLTYAHYLPHSRTLSLCKIKEVMFGTHQHKTNDWCVEQNA